MEELSKLLKAQKLGEVEFQNAIHQHLQNLTLVPTTRTSERSLDNNKRTGPWDSSEQQHLLDSLETGISVAHVVDLVVKGTNRAPSAVLRKLEKIGYLSQGRTFKSKLGHAR
ncbi:hypothetical protein [Vibrio agarivorans]|uniref:Uncharacterized protein n=1 Tax=Vibrio agarivorans TaxID=153622 RepID=A0ABT7Y7N2_9VIBR|nr:hypothetical protein [Vibrio agarivorans]MDN2484022.1 hypothetical protein [Vibrio agarivorans]